MVSQISAINELSKHDANPCIWSGQITIFHQPRFPWNKGISLTKPPFGVRSCEVAIIWPDLMMSNTQILSSSPIRIHPQVYQADVQNACCPEGCYTVIPIIREWPHYKPYTKPKRWILSIRVLAMNSEPSIFPAVDLSRVGLHQRVVHGSPCAVLQIVSGNSHICHWDRKTWHQPLNRITKCVMDNRFYGEGRKQTFSKE